ncbi:DUF4167 domain-containing protein [Methylosinus sp. Sm6]|uniref:DUF4167 domain-containing protein n=1 Tax=Methylosinus sp. Sm6 TaxID=2866948 RepID=UPI001C99E8BB|nr:DUF4167 domain-containing protein [Methylosinus sp. Sm6]MBY6242190.1 DUF4167 domain-containing protein [Methylosinus sp. Sm6]
MRPGQNKRIRGRSNRKGPNPLTRSYESNGPDVKIRGTAQHIAEKYLQLARDAQSSGDTIMAESLLQHAEHYFRLIAAAQAAQQQNGYGRPFDADAADAGEEEDDLGGAQDRFAPLSERLPQPVAYQPQPYAQPGFQPQPAAQPHFSPPPQFGQQPQPYEERPISGGEPPPRYERQPRQDRGFRDRGGRDRDRGGERGVESGGERSFDRNRERDNRRFQARPQPAPVADEQPAALPSFITAPAPIRASGGEETPESFARAERTVVREHEEAAAGFHLNSRRRRRPRAGGEEANGVDEPPARSGELPLAD